MKLHELKPAVGSVKNTKRIGRGQGSGRGGTSTKGHKGAQSRSGYSRKLGFEGGQMPLYRRVPKFGFKNINRVEYKPVNLISLQLLADAGIVEITKELLVEKGLAKKSDLVKVLGNGELSSKLIVTADAFSKSAIEAIEGKGGSVNTTNK